MSGGELFGALASLGRSLSRPFPEFPQPNFPRLRRAEAELATPARAQAPPGLAALVAEWERHIAGKGPTPAPRVLEALCWHATTACSLGFQAELAKQATGMRGRAVEGLVRSCHARWSEGLRSGAVAAARGLVAGFAGNRRQLLRWKKQVKGVLGDDGPEVVGEWLAREAVSPAKASESLGTSAASEWFHLAMRSACSRCRPSLARGESWSRLRELLGWDGWEKPEFRAEYEKTVLAAERGGDGVRDELAEMARRDSRLGDPRVAGNHNWADIGEARRRVIAWLSQFDIVFFFDHVLNARNDRHGRKEFWLRYKDRLRASRAILCEDDLLKLRRALGEKMPDTARMEGSPVTSGFILEFDRAVAVEFSAVGNALYLYASKDAKLVIGDIWAGSFSVDRLKRQGMAAARIRHWPPGVWQEVASSELAKYGVRA